MHNKHRNLRIVSIPTPCSMCYSPCSVVCLCRCAIIWAARPVIPLYWDSSSSGSSSRSPALHRKVASSRSNSRQPAGTMSRRTGTMSSKTLFHNNSEKLWWVEQNWGQYDCASEREHLILTGLFCFVLSCFHWYHFQWERLRSDLITCCASTVLVFAVSVSTAFSSPVLQVSFSYLYQEQVMKMLMPLYI